MVNNSTIINKTNSHLSFSLELTVYLKWPQPMMLGIQAQNVTGLILYIACFIYKTWKYEMLLTCKLCVNEAFLSLHQM